MPTETGKTDTMIALMVSEQPNCLLVVVPTDALRAQISKKFLSLGILQQFGLKGSSRIGKSNDGSMLDCEKREEGEQRGDTNDKEPFQRLE